jgi:ferrous iron transport protein B
MAVATHPEAASGHESGPLVGGGRASIALFGHPNVGKSVLFRRLTGRYVMVSNYPGTTVELSRGAARFTDDAAVIDTPGIVALLPRGEDEQVALRVLLEEPVQTIVQVADAKNLRRSLLLTIELAQMGLPMVLALNMMDEAQARGIEVDHTLLSSRLGLAVVPTVATRGAGVENLPAEIERAAAPDLRAVYPEAIEEALERLEEQLPALGPARRGPALLWLSGDSTTEAWVAERIDEASLAELRVQRNEVARAFSEPLAVVIQRAHLARVDELVEELVHRSGPDSTGIAARLGRLSTHRFWAWPIVAAILYGTYWFVGVFGAGSLVGWFEGTLFGKIINPHLTDWVRRAIPVHLLSDFLVGQYGLWTMGMTYALALILPIVTTFFLVFSLLEDSGYLPRLSVVTNRLFTALGLNGKAALPMALGLGCVTMATMTTRILESKRDRLLATLLLALAVPCSAQLGVVLGMLGGISLAATVIWGVVVLGVLLAVGALAARLLPGERTPLVVELPPLRRPAISNVVVKTASRLEWYLREVVPLFLAGTALLFVLDKADILPRLIDAGRPLVSGWLGLPPAASTAFLVGFLRRDFGATGLFVMQSHGQLSAQQSVVAMVTITLFIPCIASVFMIARERGYRTAMGMTALIFPLALLVGGVVHWTLFAVGWGS